MKTVLNDAVTNCNSLQIDHSGLKIQQFMNGSFDEIEFRFLTLLEGRLWAVNSKIQIEKQSLGFIRYQKLKFQLETINRSANLQIYMLRENILMNE